VEVQTLDKDVIFPNKDGDNVSSLFEGIEVVIPQNALPQQGKLYYTTIRYRIHLHETIKVGWS